MSTHPEQYAEWRNRIDAAAESLTWTVVREVIPAAEGRMSNAAMRENGWTNRDQTRFHVIVVDANGADVTEALYSTPHVTAHMKRRKDAETVAAAETERFVSEWTDRGSRGSTGTSLRKPNWFSVCLCRCGHEAPDA